MKKLSSRQKLLSKAIGVFATKGFDGTTVKDLADAAEVNIALISYHFGGKEGLFRACLETLGNDRLSASQSILKNPENKAEFQLRFKMWVDQFIELHVQQPEICQLVCRQMQENFDGLKEIFENTFLKIFQLLVDFFTLGKKRGYLSKDLDPYIIAVTVFGTIVHCSQTQHLQKHFFHKSIQDKKFRKHFIEQLCGIIQQGALRD